MELNKRQKGQEHNVVNKSVDTVDRISQLPQDIIHGILSFLPTKDAAKTSILSKTWLRWWSSFPNFDFDDSYFRLEHYFDDERRKKNFMNFINDTLQRCLEQNLNINKFRLCLFLGDREMISHIDQWVSIAVKRNVKEFYLEICPREKGLGCHNLPQTVFDSTTLTVLKLLGCNLKPYRDIKFSHLQKLCLEGDDVDEQLLENITSSCPLIKDLRIEFSYRLKYLKVLSLLHLNRIELYACRGLEQIQIGTPSLQTFHYSDGDLFRQCKLDLKACEILKELKFVDVNIKDLHQLLEGFSSKFPNLEVLVINKCQGLDNIDISNQKLKRLVLRHLNLAVARIDTPNLIALEYVYNRLKFRDVNIKDQLFQDFRSKFPNLEVLVINKCQGLDNIDISSQKLKRLVLRHLDLAVARIDTPNLIALEYVDNRMGCYSIHTPKLKEVELEFKNGSYWPYRNRYEYPLWYDELKVFLGKFANFNGLILVLQFNKIVIIHEDLKGIKLPPRENFKKLGVLIKITSMKLLDLLENLTSSYASPLHTMSIVSLSDSKLLKILYEETRYSFVTDERHVSLEEIKSFDGVEDGHGDTLLKLYEKMQYKTTTFRVRCNILEE